MPSLAGPPAARPGDVAGVLRLLAFLILATALMVLDHRGGWLHGARARVETAIQPIWWLAGLPSRVGTSLREDAVTRAQLARDNERLRNALLVIAARNARLRTAAAENARLREMLDSAQRGRLDVQLAPILDIDIDPTRQRLLLDIGATQGVVIGQPALDAGGVVGQVIEVRSSTATVLLLTDPDHAIPVAISRNGIRLVAYGRGDRLELANIPTSSDVKVGDLIVTSGLGGRFPPGFPVGTITDLRRDDSRAFLVGDLRPAAQLDRGRDVLLLRRAPVRPPIGPAPAATDTTAGTTAVGGPQAAPAAAPSSASPAASSMPPPASPTPAPQGPAAKEPAR